MIVKNTQESIPTTLSLSLSLRAALGIQDFVRCTTVTRGGSTNQIGNVVVVAYTAFKRFF